MHITTPKPLHQAQSSRGFSAPYSASSSRLFCLIYLLLLCSASYSQSQYTSTSSFTSVQSKETYPHPERLLVSSMSFTSDTQVNTYTTSTQFNSVIAVQPNGGFIIAWQSAGQAGIAMALYAQMYASNKSPSGGEFRGHTYTGGYQHLTRICALTNNKFIIAYQVPGPDGSSWGVYQTIFNADGSLFAADALVNDYTNGDQSQQSLAALPNGGFVVTWHSEGQDGDSFGIYAKIYNADGTVRKSEFAVNSITVGSQAAPFITSASDNSFVIVWRDSSASGDVYARRFNADGTPKAADFRVNTYTTDAQEAPKIASFSDNSFIIVWMSAGQEGYTSGIYFQRYRADGTTIGSETRANTYTTGGQYVPNVDTSSTGFIIAWESEGQDGSNRGVYAQRFNLDGTKKGTEFRVNTVTNDYQGTVFVKTYQDNSYIFSWQSGGGQDGDDAGVFATIFMDCDADKYQSGGTCVASCPTGYYASVNYRCIACDSSCGSCSTSATTCTGCSSTKYLSGSTCLACSSSCASCAGSASSCTSCSGSTYLLSSTCVTDCGTGKYGDTSSHTCIACDSSCTTCSGSATTCTGCSSTKYLSGSTCLACSGSCATCSGSASSCTSCSGSTYLLSSACVTDCGTGKYGDSSSHTCLACDSSCVTCSGSATSCTGCSSIKYLSGSSCLACSGSCATCAGSASSCTSCSGSTYLLSSACVTDCGTGKYGDSSSRTCLACDGSCAACSSSATSCTGCSSTKYLSGSSCLACDSTCTTCSGSSAACTSCAGSRYLLASTCVTSCGTGRYADSATHTCKNCDSSCSTCSGAANTCTACPDGKYLSGSVCLSCDASCATCSGASTTCISCTGSTYLLDSKCVTDCGNGYNADKSSHKCEAVLDSKSTAASNSKLIPIVVSTLAGVLLMSGAGYLMYAFGIRRRRQNQVQQIRVKSNSVVPDHAKLSVAP